MIFLALMFLSVVLLGITLIGAAYIIYYLTNRKWGSDEDA